MNRQKILIIITIVLVVIVVGSILLVRPASTPKRPATPIPFQISSPAPTTSPDQSSSIQVVAVLPKQDPKTEYSPITVLEVVFADDLKLDGEGFDAIKIFTNPKTEIIYSFKDSKTLRIMPKTSWTPGKTTLTLPGGSTYILNTAWPQNPDENTEY